MRILWLGNPDWAPTGYGEQLALFLPRLQALGHDVAVNCNYGFEGSIDRRNGTIYYPSDGTWGNASVATYAKHHQADMVIALCDAWVLNPLAFQEISPVAIWAPVDHFPVPPKVGAVLHAPNIRPIAMSRFGETQMRQVNLDPAYVPHAVDTQQFKPDPELGKAVREKLGIPADAYLVGMVAANKGNPSVPRKSFPQAFDAFAQFAQTHDDAWLYVHSSATPGPGGGVALDTLAEATGCPKGRVRFQHDDVWHLGFPREAMPGIFNAFDVLLNPSMGEGFGVPILEAQACGVPVIASDHSAMTELTYAGTLVTGDRWWDSLQNSFAFVPAIGSIVAALEHEYARRGDAGLRDAAVGFAAGYDADLVTSEFWVPALEHVTAQRVVPALNGHGQLNREQRRKLKRKKAAA